jgi:hypothetical protein
VVFRCPLRRFHIRGSSLPNWPRIRRTSWIP